MTSTTVPCCCLVPVEAVGLLVGRGGSTVRQLEQSTGASVQISTEEDTPPTLSDRIVTLRGSTKSQAAACREIVQQLHQTQAVEEGERGIFILVVPACATAVIIGPKGTTITGVIEASGADISISRSCIDGTDLQPISITGDLEQTVAATTQVASLLQTLSDRGRLEGCDWPPAGPSAGSGAGSVVEDRRPRAGARSRSTTPSNVQAWRGDAEDMRSRSTTPGGEKRSGPAAASAPFSAPHIRPGRSSSSAPPSRAGASSRSATPGADSRGGGADAASRSTTPGAGSRASTRASTARRTGQMMEGSFCFLVDAPLAAWIVGRKGRMIDELRTKSGASIEVAREGGAVRTVEVQGSHRAKLRAVELLLECVDGFPAGAPKDIRISLPAAAVGGIVGSARKVIKEICQSTGAEVGLAPKGAATGPGSSVGDRILLVSGPQGAVVEACQALMACIADELEDVQVQPEEHRGISPGSPRTQPGRLQSPSPAPAPARLAAGLTPPISATAPYGAELSRHSPSEAALLKVLLAGPEPSQAQLRLLLPLAFVQHVLVGRGHLHAIAARSGSRLELGMEQAAGKDMGGSQATQFVSVTGTLLGNSMAVLYIQELLIEHRIS